MARRLLFEHQLDPGLADLVLPFTVEEAAGAGLLMGCVREIERLAEGLPQHKVWPLLRDARSLVQAKQRLQRAADEMLSDRETQRRRREREVQRLGAWPPPPKPVPLCE